MNVDCREWKDELLDAALTGTPSSRLDEHLRECSGCMEKWTELRAKRERMDVLLPQLAQGAEPTPGFHARVLAAANETREKQVRRLWQLAAAAVVVAAALGLGVRLRDRTQTHLSVDDKSAAQKLADWRAPTDVLLQAPEQEMLKATPRLGDSYFALPADKDSEE
jgi:predicted anti-sigma-YlaC factor YlaD